MGAVGASLLVDKCLELLQFNLEARESKWDRRNWSDLFPGRILSSDWILLVANPGEESAPALLPLLPHLPPGVAAGVVEGKEEAAKEVREDGRNATHHQELDAGREFEGGELPLALHEGGSDDGGDGGVDQHTGQSKGLLATLVHLVPVVVGGAGGVHHPHVGDQVGQLVLELGHPRWHGEQEEGPVDQGG